MEKYPLKKTMVKKKTASEEKDKVYWEDRI